MGSEMCIRDRRGSGPTAWRAHRCAGRSRVGVTEAVAQTADGNPSVAVLVHVGDDGGGQPLFHMIGKHHEQTGDVITNNHACGIGLRCSTTHILAHLLELAILVAQNTLAAELSERRRA